MKENIPIQFDLTNSNLWTNCKQTADFEIIQIIDMADYEQIEIWATDLDKM